VDCQPDLQRVVAALFSGQYRHPLRVVAFNTREGWIRDVSAEIAREVLSCAGELDGELPAGMPARPLPPWTGLRMMPTFPRSPYHSVRRIFPSTAGRLAFHHCAARIAAGNGIGTRVSNQTGNKTKTNAEGVCSLTCAFRKLYPDVVVVQPGQDRNADRDAPPESGARLCPRPSAYGPRCNTPRRKKEFAAGAPRQRSAFGPGTLDVAGIDTVGSRGADIKDNLGIGGQDDR
jgi:hypothetical protein